LSYLQHVYIDLLSYKLMPIFQGWQRICDSDLTVLTYIIPRKKAPKTHINSETHDQDSFNELYTHMCYHMW